MNIDELKGNWKQFKGEVQQHWGKLTDDDLDRAEGNKSELVGVIQEKYGKAREEAEQEVDAWLKRH